MPPFSSHVIDLTPWVRGPSSGVGLTTWHSFRAIRDLDPLAEGVSRIHSSQYRWLHPLERFMGKKGRLYHSFEHRMPPVIHGTRLLSIHDLWTLKKGNLWQSSDFQKRQAPLLRQAIQRAHWITTPSRAVLRQLHADFPETQNRSQCIPWGNTIEQRPSQFHLEQTLRPIDRPYFLTVANFETRKNLLMIPQAVQELSGFDWVFAGKPGFGSEEIISALKTFSLKSKVKFHIIHDLPSEGLLRYYQHCEAVVLPSHDEGFGLPALEAAALSRPLILSNIEPFREIAIDGALYFDPHHGSEALRGHLLQLLEDTGLARKLSTQAFLRSQLFSWTKAAKSFTELYRKLSPI